MSQAHLQPEISILGGWTCKNQPNLFSPCFVSASYCFFPFRALHNRRMTRLRRKMESLRFPQSISTEFPSLARIFRRLVLTR